MPPPASAATGERLVGPAASATSAISLTWFVRLRWWAVAAQLAAVALARALGEPLPAGALLACAALMALTNAAVHQLRRHARFQGGWLEGGAALGALLVLDLLALTTVLARSGGPSNPFSIAYLVQVTLASVLLSARWAWSIALLSVGCYGLLFVLVPIGLHGAEHHGHGVGAAFRAHLWGMFFAFSGAAALVATFVTRVTRALSAREQELGRARERLARSERVASLMAQAAGTAHDLGTPLATIALAATELAREAAGRADLQRIGADARLIRAEVARCRELLDQLSVRAGALVGEAPATVDLAGVLDQVRDALGPEGAARLRTEIAQLVGPVRVPPRAFAQVVGNLLRNAFDASPPQGVVELRATRQGSRLRLEVCDRGPGMTPDQLARAREPFFTTKAPGTGLGLGLFLADRLAEHLGGSLSLTAREGGGTRVALELPV